MLFAAGNRCPSCITPESCPIEGFNRAAVEKILTEEGVLDTGHFGVSAMVSFGYRTVEPRPKTRQPLASVVQWV